ncbi:hypothetical protein EF919_40880, partial [Streptomyces sp. WAC02707]|uniref:enoyl-CoA hydratase-related protein n=1 Tax=Streptomyces sp. WAC02707 TaxID=2487417 RepID=UPI000F9FDE0D
MSPQAAGPRLREGSPLDFDVAGLTLQDGVAILHLRDQEGKNALTPRLHAALRSALGSAVTCPDTRVIMVRGLGAVFCSGASQAIVSGQDDSLGLPA